MTHSIPALADGLSEVTYNLVLTFSETDAVAQLRIDNLRHADLPELRKKIEALDELLSVERAHLQGLNP